MAKVRREAVQWWQNDHLNGSCGNIESMLTQGIGSQVSTTGGLKGNMDCDHALTAISQGNMKERLVGKSAGREGLGVELNGTKLWEYKPGGRVCS